VNELALFAGAGGGILGGMLHGWRTVAAVEIEDYPRRVLLQRQADGCLPRFPIWDDVRTFDGKPWRGRVDVVSGGFPCQDISCAGKGAGIEGERSGLWGEMRRIVGEVEPSNVFVENSPMLASNGLSTVLGDLASMGYDARWCVLGGLSVGRPQRRERIWILGSLADTVPRERQVGWDISRGERFCELVEENLAGTAKSEPSMVGVVDGWADRMERNRALGNGQIPAGAALAWQILNEEEGKR